MSTEDLFRYQYEDEELIHCHCCNFPAPLALFMRHRERLAPLEKENQWLCEICATTVIGDITNYPSQCGADGMRLYTSIAWIGNYIVHELRKKR